MLISQLKKAMVIALRIHQNDSVHSFKEHNLFFIFLQADQDIFQNRYLMILTIYLHLNSILALFQQYYHLRYYFYYFTFSYDYYPQCHYYFYYPIHSILFLRFDKKQQYHNELPLSTKKEMAFCLSDNSRLLLFPRETKQECYLALSIKDLCFIFSMVHSITLNYIYSNNFQLFCYKIMTIQHDFSLFSLSHCYYSEGFLVKENLINYLTSITIHGFTPFHSNPHDLAHCSWSFLWSFNKLDFSYQRYYYLCYWLI